MATGLYDKGRQNFLEGKINWLTDTIKVVFIAVTYLPDLSTHQYLSDIGTLNLVGTPQNLANKTSTDGVADASDVMFSDVMGPPIKAILIYKETDTPATSYLIAYIDNMVGFPFVPSGGKVNVSWDDGINKIFRL